MSFPRGLALLLLFAALFTLANRGAYQGFWNDDDLDNLHWTRFTAWGTYVAGLLRPAPFENNFRPIGHGFYKLYGGLFGQRFPPAIFFLHVVHFANVFLLWHILRKLGANLLGAGAGVLFFGFSMALFDAFWKPMFVFDVLCAFFLLSAFLLYLYGHWFWALAPFWLALKSKELAVTFAALLLLYELILGGRHWKRTHPFLLISGLFILQALYNLRDTETTYSFHFTPITLWTCARFYLTPVFYLAPLLLLLDRPTVRFGIAAFPCLLGPLLFLPGRLFEVYLYWPIVALAIAVAFAAQERSPRLVALLFLPWLAFNFQSLRSKRRAALTIAQENQAYVRSLEPLHQQYPGIMTVLYDPAPTYMAPWGVSGAVRWFWPAQKLQIFPVDSITPEVVAPGHDLLLLSWDRLYRKMTPLYRPAAAPVASKLTMVPGQPVWQLLEGWTAAIDGFRWTRPVASARLGVPPEATMFELGVNVGPVQVQEGYRGHAFISIDGQKIGDHEFSQQGWQKYAWPLPKNLPNVVTVEIRLDPHFRDDLGLAVTSLEIR